MKTPVRSHELAKILGAGSDDDIYGPCRIRGDVRRFYVVVNRNIGYLGVSTDDDGPTRYFVQGDEYIYTLREFQNKGACEFIREMEGLGFW